MGEILSLEFQDMVAEKESQLKKRYLKKVLLYEGSEIRSAMHTTINSKDLILTRRMIQSIDVDLVKSDIHSGDLELSFVKYLRFLDIKPKPKLKKFKTGRTKKSKVRSKGYGLYNRIVFGHFNNIINKLAYGYTEEVKAQLRAELSIELGV